MDFSRSSVFDVPVYNVRQMNTWHTNLPRVSLVFMYDDAQVSTGIGHLNASG